MHSFNDSITWTFPDLDNDSDISSLLTLDEIRALLKENQQLKEDIGKRNSEVESLKNQIAAFAANQEKLIQLITDINQKVELTLTENTQEMPLLIKEMVQEVCKFILGKKFKSSELNQIVNTILTEFNGTKNIDVFLSQRNLELLGKNPDTDTVKYKLNQELHDTEVVVSSGTKNFRFNLHETIERLLG